MSAMGRMWAAVALATAACGRGDGPAASVAFEHVTLIDGTDRGAQANMTVALDGERIVAIGPTGKLKLGKVANRIDATGMYLIPGLWDLHVHLFGYKERALPLFLANGVTTIRDVGGDLKETGYLRQEVRFGRMLGPDVLIAGPVLDAPVVANAIGAGRYATPTAEAGRAAVDSLARAGVDFLKIHSLTPPAAYFAILDQARQRGLPVVGHIPDAISARTAIDSGLRTVEHDWGLAIANSPRGPTIVASLRAAIDRYVATAGPKARLGPLFQARLAANDSGAAAYDSATAAEFARYAAERDVWFDPTLVVLHTQARSNEPEVRNPPELKFAPKEARYEDGEPPKANPTPADIAAGRARWEAAKHKFRELVRAKAKFLAGTDVPVMPLVPGFSLHRELELLVELGLTPLEALQAASRNPAQAMGKSDRGTIEVDRRADLVLLSADPLANIANTRTVQVVVVRGRLLERATLDRLLQDAELYASQR